MPEVRLQCVLLCPSLGLSFYLAEIVKFYYRTETQVLCWKYTFKGNRNYFNRKLCYQWIKGFQTLVKRQHCSPISELWCLGLFRTQFPKISLLYSYKERLFFQWTFIIHCKLLKSPLHKKVWTFFKKKRCKNNLYFKYGNKISNFCPFFSKTDQNYTSNTWPLLSLYEDAKNNISGIIFRQFSWKGRAFFSA